MSHRQARAILSLAPAAVLWLAACDDFRAPTHRAHAAAGPPTAVAGAPGRPPASEPVTPVAETVSDAAGNVAVQAPPPVGDPSGPATGTAPTPAAEPAPAPPLLQAEVLLDRAHFSPGEIDGRSGGNLRNAARAYQASRGLAATGEADAALIGELRRADSQPVLQDYVISAEDEKGPFLATVPTGLRALAKLKRVGWANPREALAEQFHMSPALLAALNPKANFALAGTRLVVARTGPADLGGKVARVEVDKAANQLRALDGAGRILAVFPATVGSTERPAPVGDWAVSSVVSDPVYSYDPKRLTFGNRARGALRVAPGPNNPVGGTWIGLTKATYGIHGAPEPAQVGKTASHGCVRLTNWDAAILGRAVAKGTPVVFVGTTRKS